MSELREFNFAFTIADVSVRDAPVVFCSQSYLKLTGFALEECLGRPQFSSLALAPETDERSSKQLVSAIDACRSGSTQLEAAVACCIRKDGHKFWNRVDIVPVTLPGQQAPRYMIYQHRLLTASEAQEERMSLIPGQGNPQTSQVANSLVAGAQLTPAARQALSGIKTTFVLSDARAKDMPILYASESFCQMTEYNMSEIVGKNCRFLQGAPTDKATVNRIRDGLARHLEVDEVILNYTKSGKPFWNALKLIPVYGTDAADAGKPMFIIGIQHAVPDKPDGTAASAAFTQSNATGKVVSTELQLAYAGAPHAGAPPPKDAPEATAQFRQWYGGNDEPAAGNFLHRINHAIESKLTNFMGNLGYKVASRPKTCMAICLAVMLLCMGGFARWKEEGRQEKLWVPQNSEAVEHFEFVGDTFSSETRRNVAYFTTDPEDGNVLTKAALTAQLTMIRSIMDAKSTYDGTESTLQDLCVKVGNDCWVSSIFSVFNYTPSVLAAMDQAQIMAAINDPAAVGARGTPLDLDRLLGGSTKDAAGTVTEAKSTVFSFFLENNLQVIDGGNVDPAAEAWEGVVLDLPRTLDGVEMHPALERSTSDEFGAAIQGDIQILSIGYFLVIAYCCTALGKLHRVHTRALVALGGVFSVGLSIATSFGLCSLFGVPYGPVNSVLPFLLLGVGVDDMFIISNAFDQTNPQDPIPDRIGLALSRAGVSITVTSATDFLAFLIGASTQLPALSFFCIFAAVGILADFAFQCTFFVACLAIDAQRVKENKVACCCCVVSKNHDPVDVSRKPIKDFMESRFAPFLMRNPCRFATLGIFAILLGVSIYGATQIEQEFDFNDFIPDDSYLQITYGVRDKYYPPQGSPVFVIMRDLEFHTNLDKLQEAAVAFQASYGVIENSVDSWIAPFKAWRVAASVAALDSEQAFATQVQQFVASPPYARYANDFVMNADKSMVTASRMMGMYTDFETSKDEVKALNDIRDKIDAIGFENKVFAFSFVYLFWEQYAIIDTELYQNLGLAALAVFVVTLLLIAHPGTALLVLFCVCSAVTCVLGLMHFWGIAVNSVAVINLVLALGLAVDYSAHIGHCFMLNHGSRSERAKGSLTEIGGSVINGAVSTLLPVLALGASQSFIFRTFFKQFVLVIGLGVAHGILLLPVLLSFVGPKSVGQSAAALPTFTPRATKGIDGTEMTAVTSTEPSPYDKSPVTQNRQ